MFNKDMLNEIFNLAQRFRMYVHKERDIDYVLKVCMVVTSLFETFKPFSLLVDFTKNYDILLTYCKALV